jgi:hypothetical protein
MTGGRHAKPFAMLLALLLGTEAAMALAAPKPVPGAANQTAGVQGDVRAGALQRDASPPIDVALSPALRRADAAERDG